MQVEDDAEQVAKGREAEDHAGDSKTESWRVHDNIFLGFAR